MKYESVKPHHVTSHNLFVVLTGNGKISARRGHAMAFLNFEDAVAACRKGQQVVQTGTLVFRVLHEIPA